MKQLLIFSFLFSLSAKASNSCPVSKYGCVDKSAYTCVDFFSAGNATKNQCGAGEFIEGGCPKESRTGSCLVKMMGLTMVYHSYNPIDASLAERDCVRLNGEVCR